jgi:futalosine hydrolase
VTLLVVTAVAAEAEAVLRGLPAQSGVTVAPVGVGPAAAAAGTARLLALADGAFEAVLSAGIAGGIGVPPGGLVLARNSIAADLGADSPEGFLSLDELGFGAAVTAADPQLLERLRLALPDATLGDVLTVSTVTGTAERAAVLVARHPDAIAEAMEGYGVGCAARDFGLPFAELRAVSNLVGPRDRSAWQIGAALAALTEAAAGLAGATVSDLR